MKLDEMLTRQLHELHRADLQSRNGYAMTGVQASRPGREHRGLQAVVEGTSGLELFAQRGGRDWAIIADGESQVAVIAGDLRRLERSQINGRVELLGFARIATDGDSRGMPHRVEHAIGELLASSASRGVVLPHADVAAAAVEVNLKDAGLLFQSLPREAGDIPRDAGVAIKAQQRS